MSRSHRAVRLTPVELAAQRDSSRGPSFPGEEQIPALIVENFPALGRLAALRFLEWVQQNPEGVISLPTGKTPEHFINWVEYLLANWDKNEVRAELESAGLDPARRPELRGLRFVQIDEFYPMDPAQHNSFLNYVRRFYIRGFGLDESRALLIDPTMIGLSGKAAMDEVWPGRRVDLSLRYRDPRSALERRQQKVLLAVDQWCQSYESRVRELGGIGFFLGGIGPDGHIGFNVRGSDHRSVTRLTETNYQTQAAAATDLGGMEVARSRLVITIGLGTICHNPDCVAVVLAAGEAKSRVVANAVCNRPSIEFPATALQHLPGARFYLTAGAARDLPARRLEIIEHRPELSVDEIERAVIDLSVRLGKPLAELSSRDGDEDVLVSAAVRRSGKPLEMLAGSIREAFIERIERGMQVLSGTRFLHTEPHHDDLMLGCLPYIVRNGRVTANQHHFVTLTGGFTAVTNGFLLKQIELLRRFLYSRDFRQLFRDGYFSPAYDEGRSRDVWQFLDGLAAESRHMMDEGAARRRLREIISVYEPESLEGAADCLDDLERRVRSCYPGQKDSPDVQRLKARCREWEAECTWGYFGWSPGSVFHLGLGFYTGDLFTEEPTEERDVPPILEVIRRTRPDVVSVALDPEASGPDTHYKALQAAAGALEAWQRESGCEKIRVVGYRNIWQRFDPSEANLFVPVSLNMFAIMQSAFMNTFASQRDASFPSPDYDGPFCELAQRIQARQYSVVKNCLGREWFHQHPSALIRATRGFVFLKEMDMEDFRRQARELRRSAENR